MAKKKKKDVDTTIDALDPNRSKVEYVTDKFSTSRDYYSELRTKFTDWDDLYFSVPRAKKHDWMSNIFDPETHKAVMTLLSRVVNNTFSVDPAFDVMPSNKYVSNLVRSQLYRGNFFSQWVFFCTQLLIRGTSIGKISWQKDVKTRFTLEKVMENAIQDLLQGKEPTSKYVKKPIQKVRYDGPVFETIDLFDFFPEPHSADINKGARIFRSTIPKNDFMKNSNYSNKDAVLATTMPENDGWFHSRLKSLGIQEPTLERDKHLPTERAKNLSDFVELLECETEWWNAKTGRLEPWLLTVANRKVLVRDEAFPYWNTSSLYVKGVWIPVLGEFYGIGIPELAECLQEELNDKKNQRLDNVNQILQGGWLMYEDNSVDPKVMKRFQPKPGAKLRTRPGAVSGQQIRHEYLQDITGGTAAMEISSLKSAIEEVTGAVKAIQPSSGGGDVHRTSSGIMLMQSMANERIKFNLSLIEKDTLEPIFEKYQDMNLQFLSPGYRIFNPEGKTEIYSPEMIAGDYEFRAKGSRYALDQQMKVMNISRALESLGATGVPLGELHVKFYMKLYDAMGFEDKEEVEQILRGEIKKQQEMQQQALMAKAQGAGGQGGGQGPSPDNAGAAQQMIEAMGVNQGRSDAGQMIPGGGG